MADRKGGKYLVTKKGTYLMRPKRITSHIYDFDRRRLKVGQIIQYVGMKKFESVTVSIRPHFQYGKFVGVFSDTIGKKLDPKSLSKYKG